MTTTKIALVLSLAAGVCLAGAYVWLTSGEVRDDRYDSYREALGTVERGWLPAALPRSATQIHAWYDLDTSERVGSFRFDPRERPDIESALRPGSGPAIRIDRDPSFARTLPLDSTEVQIHDAGFEFYTADDFGLAVNWTTGIAYFWSSSR